MLSELQVDYIKSTACDIEEVFPTLPHDVITFIACQFALESSFGTSRLAKECHNHCGMKAPLVRPSTALNRGVSVVFADYPNKYFCIVDYFLCLSYHQPLAKQLENLDLFKHFIKFYCPEKDYVNKIINLFNQFKNEYKKSRH